MNKNINYEVMPIELETSRTAAVNLLFECTKTLLLKTRMTEPMEADLFENNKEVMLIDNFN